jgi:hypothetical protein
MSELENIFRSTEDSSLIPMINERLNVLHETGLILVKVIHLIFFILKKFFN